MSDARIYVGTYAKYNDGNLKGEWLDLDDYGDAEAFATACRELHSDENDPELMFQDFEGFPKAFYGESHLDPRIWEWLGLDEQDQELWAVYLDKVDPDASFESARDAFMGTAKDEADWAYEYLNDCGMLASLPDWARNYFDFEAYARDAGIGGDVTFVRHDGELWVFSNH